MVEEDGSVIQDHLFNPFGYSMNGVVAKDCYWTIHITPEAHCSYVSFESNVRLASYDDLIAKVVGTFRPSRFTAVVHANAFSPFARKFDGGLCKMVPANVVGYSITTHSMASFGKRHAIQLANYETRPCSEDDDCIWSSASSANCSSIE